MVRVTLLAYSSEGDKLIALAAKRTLSRKELELEYFDSEDVNAWIVETLKRQHFSVWEFSWYVFEVADCSRVCSHQLVRHRIASYAQLSQRYSDHVLRYVAEYAQSRTGVVCAKKDYRCYANTIKKLLEKGRDADIVEAAERGFVLPPTAEKEIRVAVAKQCLAATAEFYELLSKGVRAEDARYALPQAVKTRILVAMNARELMHFLGLRMCSRAQWEIREVAWLLWKELVKVHPKLFRWAGPRCVQVENLTRVDPRPLEEFLEGGASFTIARCPEGVPRQGIAQCLRSAASVLWNSSTETPSEAP